MSTIWRLSIFHIWSHFLLVENLEPGLLWPVATSNINPDAFLSQCAGLVDLSWTCLFPSFSITFSLFSHSFGNQSSLSLVFWIWLHSWFHVFLSFPQVTPFQRGLSGPMVYNHPSSHPHSLLNILLLSLITLSAKWNCLIYLFTCLSSYLAYKLQKGRGFLCLLYHCGTSATNMSCT